METPLDPLDLSYAAGLIDGEGTIGITELKAGGKRADGRAVRQSPQHRVYVAVTMTDETCIHWLFATFGGNLQSLKSRNVKHRPTFRWSMANQSAVEFCERLAPYLKLKRAQAEIVCEFYRKSFAVNYQGHSGVPVDELARRREFHSQIKVLNRRGVASNGV